MQMFKLIKVFSIVNLSISIAVVDKVGTARNSYIKIEPQRDAVVVPKVQNNTSQLKFSQKAKAFMALAALGLWSCFFLFSTNVSDSVAAFTDTYDDAATRIRTDVKINRDISTFSDHELLFSKINEIELIKYNILKISTNTGVYAAKMFWEKPRANGARYSDDVQKKGFVNKAKKFLLDIRFAEITEASQYSVGFLDYYAGNRLDVFDEGLQLFIDTYGNLQDEDKLFFGSVRENIVVGNHPPWLALTSDHLRTTGLFENSTAGIEYLNVENFERFPCHLTPWSHHGDFDQAMQKLKKENAYGYEIENIDYTEMLHYLKLMVLPLQEIHAKRIAHKDLKEKNYIVSQVDEKGRPQELMLLDFGSSNRFEDEDLWQNKGTHFFQAPETKTKSSYDTRCIDMWSVGMILIDVLGILDQPREISKNPYIYSHLLLQMKNDIQFRQKNVGKSINMNGEQEVDKAFLLFLLSHILHKNIKKRPTSTNILDVLDSVAGLRQQAQENGHDLSSIVDFFSGAVLFDHIPMTLNNIENISANYFDYSDLEDLQHFRFQFQELKTIIANPESDVDNNLYDLIALTEKLFSSIEI